MEKFALLRFVFLRIFLYADLNMPENYRNSNHGNCLHMENYVLHHIVLEDHALICTIKGQL